MKNNILNPYVKGLADGADRALHIDAKLMQTPSVEPDVGMFLESFTSSVKPKSILELGCGIGVSTRYMSRGAPDADITAVDYNKSRLDYAVEGCQNNKKIKFIYSNVIDFLKTDENKYDMIFVDSMKKHYPIVFYYAFEMLNEGGTIIFDDVFMYGEIFKQDSEIATKYLATVRILRNFIEKIKNSHRHCLLPIGSGLLVVNK